MRRSLQGLRQNEVARNVLTLGAGNLVGQIITIAAIPILSRIYGPAAYGFLAIYVSISTLVSVVATGRYEFAILLPDSRREAIATRNLSRQLLWMVSGLMLILLASSLDQVADLLNADKFKYWLLTIPVHILLLGELSILTQWHTRQKQFRTQSRNRILLNGSIVLLQLALGISLLPDIRGLISGLLVAQIFGCAFLAAKQGIDRSESRTVTRKDVVAVLKRYRKMPLLNAPTALLDSVRANGVNLVIGNRSLTALGQYSMAWRSVQIPLGLIGSALSQVFFQRMSRVSRDGLFPIVFASTWRSLLFSAPFFVLIFVFAPSLLPLFLGSEWGDAGSYAQALTPWLYLNLATSPIATVFVVTETQGRQALFGVFYTAAAIVSLLAFPNGLATAVWAMSLTMTGCLVLFIALALYTAREHDRKRMARAAGTPDGSEDD